MIDISTHKMRVLTETGDAMKPGERKLQILKLIIDDFIDTAQPVGSRTIAKKYELGISSATIRNEMADLEDLGYLIQPHTSAGRVPSELGYRLYVDSLMKHMALELDERQVVRNLLVRKIIRVEDVVQQAAELLASMTQMIAVVSLPQFKKTKLVNMKLIRINESSVLLILVSDAGVFKNIPMELSDLEQYHLDRLSDGLLAALKGATIQDISVKTVMKLKTRLPEYGPFIDYLIPILRDALRALDETEVRIEGTGYIFDKPEYNDIEKARTFMETLQDKDSIIKIFDDVTPRGITVKIGNEIGLEALRDASIVAAGYRINEDTCGHIGVIGPTRINYGHTVTVVESFRQTLSEIFSGINL